MLHNFIACSSATCKVILNYHAALQFGSVKNIRTCQPQISDSGASSTSKSAKADGMHYSNKVFLFSAAWGIWPFGAIFLLH